MEWQPAGTRVVSGPRTPGAGGSCVLEAGCCEKVACMLHGKTNTELGKIQTPCCVRKVLVRPQENALRAVCVVLPFRFERTQQITTRLFTFGSPAEKDSVGPSDSILYAALQLHRASWGARCEGT